MNSPEEVKEKLLKAEAHTPQACSGGGQATSNGHLMGRRNTGPQWGMRIHYSKIRFHTEYFKWKESETAGEGRTFWPSPEVGIKTLKRETPFVHPGERNIPTFKKEGHQEKSGWTNLAKSPLVYYTELIRIPTFVHHIFPQLSTVPTLA